MPKASLGITRIASKSSAHESCVERINSRDSNDLREFCYHYAMQLLSANQAKTQFGQMMDLAQKEPVRITRHNRVVGVMVSAQDYEDMRAFYADRLTHTLQATALAAQARGLTQGKLDELLSDES